MDFFMYLLIPFHIRRFILNTCADITWHKFFKPFLKIKEKSFNNFCSCIIWSCINCFYSEFLINPCKALFFKADWRQRAGVGFAACPFNAANQALFITVKEFTFKSSAVILVNKIGDMI